MNCAKHPNQKLFINGECLLCYSMRKKEERALARLMYDIHSIGWALSPTQQAERIIAGRKS